MQLKSHHAKIILEGVLHDIVSSDRFTPKKAENLKAQLEICQEYIKGQCGKTNQEDDPEIVVEKKR